jgi:hypothetical protein
MCRINYATTGSAAAGVELRQIWLLKVGDRVVFLLFLFLDEVLE